MVILNVKKGEECQFLYNTSVSATVEDVTVDVATIYNGRLKISRLCYEIEELAKYGTLYPPEILGLTDDQVEELKLKDTWGEKCEPSGGFQMNKDPIGRRNGKQPNEHMQGVLTKTIAEAKAIVSKKQIQAGVCLTQKQIQEAIDLLRGAVTIVYPMNLPPHDVITQEFQNTENLDGTQASLEVVDTALAQLWFSGKELMRGKKLSDYVGTNDKTKITVKLTVSGHGPPAREAVISEEERKLMMAHAYRRQEELKDEESPLERRRRLARERQRRRRAHLNQQQLAEERYLDRVQHLARREKESAEQREIRRGYERKVVRKQLSKESQEQRMVRPNEDAKRYSLTGMSAG